ncbi:MAG: ROK family protein [Rhizobiales bacterium]|nr:ROK family protein [Hyphomicrobiales bacterium]
MNRIGIDMGGTKIDCVALSPDGQVVFEKRVPTPRGYEAVVATIAELVKLAGEGSVGIGAPGSESPKTGLWRNSNVQDTQGKPFRRDLEKAIGRPVRMENDANCVALSEALDGAGVGKPIVAFFTVGTALGGGLVVNGKLVHGINAEAGEFGHTPLPWPNESEWPLIQCFCGKKGCAEKYVSGTGLQQDHAKVTGEQKSGKEIVAAARAGNPKAMASLDRLADRFARICANIQTIIDPDVIVVGGGLSELPELVEQLPPRISRYSFSGTAQVPVLRAAFGEKSGVRGAARLWD